MIENLLDMLEIAKKSKKTGKYTSIALGEYKFPETYREAIKLHRRQTWPYRKQ